MGITDLMNRCCLLVVGVAWATGVWAQEPVEETSELDPVEAAAIAKAAKEAAEQAKRDAEAAEAAALAAANAVVYEELKPSFELIADKKFDEWIDQYCSNKLCLDDEDTALVRKEQLPKLRALKCLVGKERAYTPTRTEGDPRTDAKLKVYVQCTPLSRAPQPFLVVKEDGAWVFRKL
jgi:hypothetical protein